MRSVIPQYCHKWLDFALFCISVLLMVGKFRDCFHWRDQIAPGEPILNEKVLKHDDVEYYFRIENKFLCLQKVLPQSLQYAKLAIEGEISLILNSEFYWMHLAWNPTFQALSRVWNVFPVLQTFFHSPRIF